MPTDNGFHNFELNDALRDFAGRNGLCEGLVALGPRSRLEGWSETGEKTHRPQCRLDDEFPAFRLRFLSYGLSI
jgi:hypothetical protein